MDIISLNVSERIAIREDNLGGLMAVPITNLFDEHGRATNDDRKAVSAVAGSGCIWFTVLLSDYKWVSKH